MKRFSLVILLSLLVMAFGSPNAGITLDSVYGLESDTSLFCGETIEFRLRWISQPDLSAGDTIKANTNGFRLYDSGTGTIWSYPLADSVVIDTVGAIIDTNSVNAASWNPDIDWVTLGYDAEVFANLFSTNGQGADTIGFGGFRIFGTGLTDALDTIFATIKIEVACSETGNQICLDSSWYRPVNPWLWDALDSGQILDVSWDGPHCYWIGSMAVGVEDGVNDLLPTVFALKQNYPNPFNPATTINFDVPYKSHVKISIYNILGQRVAVPLDRDMNAGPHQVEWNAAKEGVSSGVYFFKMEAGDFVKTRKMMLLK